MDWNFKFLCCWLACRSCTVVQSSLLESISIKKQVVFEIQSWVFLSCRVIVTKAKFLSSLESACQKEHLYQRCINGCHVLLHLLISRAIARACDNLARPDKNTSDAVDVRSELDLRIGRHQTLILLLTLWVLVVILERLCLQ